MPLKTNKWSGVHGADGAEGWGRWEVTQKVSLCSGLWRSSQILQTQALALLCTRHVALGTSRHRSEPFSSSVKCE